MKHNLLFGIIYSLSFIPLSVIPINPEVTGPLIFFSPVFTWPLVLVALYFSKRLQTLLNRIFFVALLLVHYTVTVLLIVDSWPDQYPRIDRMLGRGEGPFLYFIIAWYMAGQIMIWTSFFRRSEHGRPDELP